MALTLQSEPYSAFGNISASGIGKILGVPSHDRLRILIRETVQNTWDARSTRHGKLEYRVRYRSLTQAQRHYLLGEVLSELPRNDIASNYMEESLSCDSLALLEIEDYGTSGLGGPVRPDRLTTADESSDFVDFVRNIGTPRDTPEGGGTYGYGKSSLYRCSALSTVIIHSVGEYQNRAHERLIACHLGSPFQNEVGRFTGRHWWGVCEEDDFVGPASGEQASELALGLGLAARNSERFGTTLAIVCPDLEHRNPLQAINAIQETLFWFFWPKMIATESERRVRFRLFLEDQEVLFPDIDNVGPIRLFAQSLEAIHGSENGTSTEAIECLRPRQVLGVLGIKKGPVTRRFSWDTGDEEPLIPDISSHVALMRPAELVVKYLQGPAMTSDLVEYAGAFVCESAVEEAFAASEPPAHDDWEPANLSGHDKTFVKVALRNIKDEMRDSVASRFRTPEITDEVVPLGLVSDTLGGLLVGQAGTRVRAGIASPERTEGQRRKRQRSGGGPRVTVSKAEHTGFELFRGTPAAFFRFNVSGRAVRTTLIAEIRILTDQGSTTDVAAGEQLPKVLAWFDEQNEVVGEEERLLIETGDKEQLTIAVSLSLDRALSIEISAEMAV